MLAAVAPAGEKAHVALALRAHSPRLLGVDNEGLRKLEPISGRENVPERRAARKYGNPETCLPGIAPEDKERLPDRRAGRKVDFALGRNGPGALMSNLADSNSHRIWLPVKGKKSKHYRGRAQNCKACWEKRSRLGSAPLRKSPHPTHRMIERGLIMATKAQQKNKAGATPRILNKRATFDYTIEERFEAGLVLRGWEVKSVRAGRTQINLAHVYIRDGELFLCNAHMNPADQVCTHETLETNRTRKLLMHRREIMKLIGRVERQGYTLIPLNLHFSKGRVKVDIALARGKREYEKRADESKKEWKREQERIMKKDSRGRNVY